MTQLFLLPLALLGSLITAAPSPVSLNSDLTILINNDLQGPSSPTSHSGVILLDERTYSDAVSACQALGEELWSPDLKLSSIQPNLDYLQYQGKADDSTLYWVADQRTIKASGELASASPDWRHPALCTQTAPYSIDTTQDTNTEWQVTVVANNENLTGFRDRLSFRFLGVRYAPQPQKFTYSTAYKGSGGNVSVLSYGSECVQGSSGSEDCLFLNIWTPYLPKPGGSSKPGNLRPVMFWIHGGGFTSGTANDNTFDGGNLASRGDVVMVAINYRLSTLGFLALEDGLTNGNFGFADQINALDWVRNNIQAFGGDPDRITIFGQSAGAGSVRAMMASPRAVGKFANAIPMSNLGGIQYGTTYSEYYTIPEEVSVAANSILNATNCTHAASQVDCLRAAPAYTLSSLDTVARYLVVDGTYLTSDQLDVTDGGPFPFNLLMGIMQDDGAALISYPGTANESAYLTSQDFAIPSPTLFPVPMGANATLDLYNMSSRLATDGIFRCVDQATVSAGLASGRFARVFYYEFDRSYQTSGWPGTDVCEAPITTSHPFGDPSLPYFKCHSGELYYVFGNLARQGLPMRDDADLPFEQFALDSFASFARSADPNPDEGLLAARGYTSTLQELKRAGKWKPSTNGDLTMRVLQWPTYQGLFRDLPQCESLGLGLDYYE